MNILVIGDKEQVTACQEKFGKAHQYVAEENIPATDQAKDNFDVVFDFNPAARLNGMEAYRGLEGAVKFLNATQVSLKAMAGRGRHSNQGPFFGFCGMPSFLNREVMEISIYRPEDQPFLEKACRGLGTDYRAVKDRIGLVSARIICMIINEAYFAVQEGIASREDIDLAMKLGANYPHGPFDWCRKIGIDHVCELLNAVYQDTHDNRYAVCDLLKKESGVER